MNATEKLLPLFLAEVVSNVMEPTTADGRVALRGLKEELAQGCARVYREIHGRMQWNDLCARATNELNIMSELVPGGRAIIALIATQSLFTDMLWAGVPFTRQFLRHWNTCMQEFERGESGKNLVRWQENADIGLHTGKLWWDHLRKNGWYADGPEKQE